MAEADKTIGFIKTWRSDEAFQLAQDPPALALLLLVALRARYAPGGLDGLAVGQAQIGDWHSCGLTRKQYRCAMARLERMGLCSFHPIKGVGTVATLLDECIFSISGHGKGHLPQSENLEKGPSAGPERGHLGANNKKGRKEEKEESSPLSSFDRIVAEVEAMPEFQNRADVRDIAKRIGADRVRNAATLADRVRHEYHPVYKSRRPLQQSIEPSGWQEWLADAYPGCNYLPGGLYPAASFYALPPSIQAEFLAEKPTPARACA